MKTLTPFLLVAFAPLAQPARHSIAWFYGSLVIGRLASGANDSGELELWNASSILETVTAYWWGETGLDLKRTVPRGKSVCSVVMFSARIETKVHPVSACFPGMFARRA
jgi:hypothetical protein